MPTLLRVRLSLFEGLPNYWPTLLAVVLVFTAAAAVIEADCQSTVDQSCAGGFVPEGCTDDNCKEYTGSALCPGSISPNRYKITNPPSSFPTCEPASYHLTLTCGEALQFCGTTTHYLDDWPVCETPCVTNVGYGFCKAVDNSTPCQ